MNKALCSLVAMPLVSTTRPSFSGFVVVSAVLRAIYGIHNVQGLTMYCCGLSGFDDSLK